MSANVTARGAFGRRILLAGVAGGAASTAVLAAAGCSSDRSGKNGSANIPGAEAAAKFSDIDESDPLAPVFGWCHTHVIQPGFSDGTYRPDAPVSRVDLALVLHAFAGAPGLVVDPLPIPFTDIPTDPVQSTAVLWLHVRGGMWGDSQLQLRPGDRTTPAQTALALSALVRPGLAAGGYEQFLPEEPLVDDSPLGPSDEQLDQNLSWLEDMDLLPANPSAEWQGAEAVTRRDLADVIHRVETMIEHLDG